MAYTGKEIKKENITANSSPSNPLFILNTGQSLDKLELTNTGTGAVTVDIGSYYGGDDIVDGQAVPAKSSVVIDVGGFKETLGYARMKIYVTSADWTNVTLKVVVEVTKTEHFDRLSTAGDPQVLVYIEGGVGLWDAGWHLLSPTYYKSADTGSYGEHWVHAKGYSPATRLSFIGNRHSIGYSPFTKFTNRVWLNLGGTGQDTFKITYTMTTAKPQTYAQITDGIFKKLTHNGTSITPYRATNFPFFTH